MFFSEQRLPLSTVYRGAGSRSNHSTRDLLSTLQDHDISGNTGGDSLDTSTSFMMENLGTSQRRRKSPLFDGEIISSPKKKAKETTVTAAAATQPLAAAAAKPKLHFTKELTSRQRYVCNTKLFNQKQQRERQTKIYCQKNQRAFLISFLICF